MFVYVRGIFTKGKSRINDTYTHRECYSKFFIAGHGGRTWNRRCTLHLLLFFAYAFSNANSHSDANAARAHAKSRNVQAGSSSKPRKQLETPKAMHKKSQQHGRKVATFNMI
jgi:hypothetical protein